MKHDETSISPSDFVGTTRPSGDLVEQKAVEELLKRLHQSPREFGFFQSLLLLTRSLPGMQEPGEGDDQTRDPFLLRSWPSMVRSATDIRSLTKLVDDEAKPPYEMEVSFMGLYGSLFADSFLFLGLHPIAP